jgi:hypothetical protein
MWITTIGGSRNRKVWPQCSDPRWNKKKGAIDDDVSILKMESHDFLASPLEILRFSGGILFYIIAKITKFG